MWRFNWQLGIKKIVQRTHALYSSRRVVKFSITLDWKKKLFTIEYINQESSSMDIKIIWIDNNYADKLDIFDSSFSSYFPWLVSYWNVSLGWQTETPHNSSLPKVVNQNIAVANDFRLPISWRSGAWRSRVYTRQNIEPTSSHWSSI